MGLIDRPKGLQEKWSEIRLGEYTGRAWGRASAWPFPKCFDFVFKHWRTNEGFKMTNNVISRSQKDVPGSMEEGSETRHETGRSQEIIALVQVSDFKGCGLEHLWQEWRGINECERRFASKINGTHTDGLYGFISFLRAMFKYMDLVFHSPKYELTPEECFTDIFHKF